MVDIGDLHSFGTIYGVFNIRGMGFPLKYEDFNMALYVGMAK